jgi:hypothetical protein
MDRTELLRIPLNLSTHQRKVLVDPDEQAPAVETILVTAANDDERLLVLRAHRVEKFRSVVTAALPIGPDESDGTGIFVIVGE